MERYIHPDQGRLDRAVRWALTPLDLVTSSVEAVLNNKRVLDSVEATMLVTDREARRARKLLKRTLGFMAVASMAYLLAQCTPYQDHVNAFVSQAQHIAHQPNCAPQPGNPSLLICQ